MQGGRAQIGRAAAMVGLLALAACHGPAKPAAESPSPTPPSAQEAGYLTPPRVERVEAGPDGAVVLTGISRPGALVTLVQIPSRQEQTMKAGEGGLWRASLPLGGQPRFYALSSVVAGRTVQAEGYLVVTPDARAALLRAGSGARVVAAGSQEPRILAVDYDRDGAAVISGVARDGAGIAIRIDRTPGGDLKTGADGRFAFPLSATLHAGAHLIDVAGEGGMDAVQVTVGAPAAVGVYSAERAAQGWRVDWTTPGGGAQTTLLLVRAEGP